MVGFRSDLGIYSLETSKQDSVECLVEKMSNSQV